MRFTVFVFLFSISALPAFSQNRNLDSTSFSTRRIVKLNDTLSYLYETPKPFTFVKNVWLDVKETPMELFKKENMKGLGVVIATSAVFIYFDQEIADGAQQFGRYIGLSRENNTYSFSPIKQVPLYVPTDLSSGLYYIGDGLTELGVNAAFYIYGKTHDDARALRTASELTEGIATVGIFIQILKHATGHETPDRASVPGGRWRFFINPAKYQESVPKYDAFPSGHLATAMVTTTIISMNYPEYKFIKPLCYTLMGLCGYQMINNGVHWMGDYPLAIALGYTIGKLAVKRGRTVIETSRYPSFIPKIVDKFKWSLHPVYLGYNTPGVTLSLTF